MTAAATLLARLIAAAAASAGGDGEGDAGLITASHRARAAVTDVGQSILAEVQRNRSRPPVSTTGAAGRPPGGRARDPGRRRRPGGHRIGDRQRDGFESRSPRRPSARSGSSWRWRSPGWPATTRLWYRLLDLAGACYTLVAMLTAFIIPVRSMTAGPGDERHHVRSRTGRAAGPAGRRDQQQGRPRLSCARPAGRPGPGRGGRGDPARPRRAGRLGDQRGVDRVRRRRVGARGVAMAERRAPELAVSRSATGGAASPRSPGSSRSTMGWTPC